MQLICFFQEYLDRKKMTEFGSMALFDEGGGGEDAVAIPLPGVKRGIVFGFAVLLLALCGSNL